MANESNELVLDVAQAHEIKMAMNRPGNGPWTPELVKELTKGDTLGRVRDVLLRRAEINAIQHVIDGDAAPFCPDGWSVEEHKKTGQMKLERKGADLYLDGKKIDLYLSKPQQKGKTIGGNELRKELKDKDALNANSLDYLLAHPELIPDEWKGKAVFFWGTIYRNSDGYLCVRCLYWNDGGWGWGDFWLDFDWNSYDPAALRAS